MISSAPATTGAELAMQVLSMADTGLLGLLIEGTDLDATGKIMLSIVDDARQLVAQA
jgi:hypothetical protein